MVVISILSIVVLLFCRKFFFYEFDFREDKYVTLEKEKNETAGNNETAEKNETDGKK